MGRALFCWLRPVPMPPAAPSTPRILTATARHRVVAAYAAPPDRLTARLPEGLVPDTRDGTAFVCLVGVQLIDVRVLGWAGPGFRRVPAVELQVPVRTGEGGAASRGTLTVQAYVPRRLVAWAARGLYGEPVAVTSMQPVWKTGPDEVALTYRFDRAGREQRLRVVGTPPPVAPAPDTLAAFLRDRSWRYGAAEDGPPRRAYVERPAGPLYRVTAHHVTVHWARVFGDAWAFLDDRAPRVVLCDPGGPLALHWHEPVG